MTFTSCKQQNKRESPHPGRQQNNHAPLARRDRIDKPPKNRHEKQKNRAAPSADSPSSGPRSAPPSISPSSPRSRSCRSGPPRSPRSCYLLHRRRQQRNVDDAIAGGGVTHFTHGWCTAPARSRGHAARDRPLFPFARRDLLCRDGDAFGATRCRSAVAGRHINVRPPFSCGELPERVDGRAANASAGKNRYGRARRDVNGTVGHSVGVGGSGDVRTMRTGRMNYKGHWISKTKALQKLMVRGCKKGQRGEKSRGTRLIYIYVCR